MGSASPLGAGGLWGDSKIGTVFKDVLSPQPLMHYTADRLGISRNNPLVKAGDFGATDRWTRDIGGKYNAESKAKEAELNVANKAAEVNRNLLLQPKVTTPDNFLAQKAKQLSSLRLGLASTITPGSGSAPSAVLGSPSLIGNYPGKAKLGQ